MIITAIIAYCAFVAFILARAVSAAGFCAICTESVAWILCTIFMQDATAYIYVTCLHVFALLCYAYGVSCPFFYAKELWLREEAWRVAKVFLLCAVACIVIADIKVTYFT